MSPIRDVQKSQDPAEETPALGKDSKCPSPNEQTQTLDVIPTKEIEYLLSASESIKPNNQSEIDAIQKHVEDSLLFLDYDKDSKTNNSSKNMTENIDRTVHTDSLKKIVMENPISEQAGNKTEDPEKMDRIQAIGDKSSTLVEAQNDTNVVSASDNVHLEASNIASTHESVNETTISVEQVQIITKIPEKIDEDMENNVLLEQSQLKENIEHEIKSSENVNNDVPIQDTIWETSLSVEQLRKESDGEYIAHLQNTSDEGLALNDAQKTSVVSEQIYVNNVQEPSQITHLLENFKERPLLDIAIKETDNVITKNDVLSESELISVQKTFLKNQISSEHVSENIPGNTQNKVLEPLLENITDIPILESFKEDLESHEKVGDNVQPSETPLSVEQLRKESEGEDNAHLQNNSDEGLALNDAQKTSVVSEQIYVNNVQEPSQIPHLLENFKESPLLDIAIKETDNVITKNYVLSESKPESVQKTFQKNQISSEHVSENKPGNTQNKVLEPLLENITDIPILESFKEDSESHDKMTTMFDGDNVQPSETPLSVEQLRKESEGEDNAHLQNTSDEGLALNDAQKTSVVSEQIYVNNVEEPSQITHLLEKSHENVGDNVQPSEIEPVKASIQESPNPKRLYKNTDINDDLEQTQFVRKQKSPWKSPISTEQTQKEPERNIENVIYNSKSAHSGVLKAVPIQEQEQIKTEKPKENIIYNENSAHSGSLRVVPIRDLNEYPPAKRARTEADNSHSLPSNAYPAIESVQESRTRSFSQCETTNVSASNIPQSSSLSIIEDTPMDIDSDNSDTEILTFDTADDGQHYKIKDLSGFKIWCEANGLFEINKNTHLPHNINVEKCSKQNKGVLKIAKLPRYFNRCDVRQLIHKHTAYVDKEIVSNITFIYIDETSSSLFNSALVKWRDQDMLDTVKAFLLLKKANLYIDGEKLRLSYDSRQKVEWVNEKPIQRSNLHNRNRRKSLFRAPTVMSAASASRPINTCSNIKPFTKGQIDFDDPIKYGLSQEFLAHLKVKLPLTTDIFIKNLDQELDDEKLRRIFGIAGTIRDLRKYPNSDWLNVRIQYDHPLEAIQAISMFDQVALNDRTITVSMTKGKIKDVIPEGFNAIGPGLCQNGRPMLNIRANMEIAQIKSKCDMEMDKLKQKIAFITNNLRSLKSHQIRIKQVTAEAASQENRRNVMPVQQEPLNAMAALHQNLQNAVIASQQNPQNAVTTLQQNPQNAMAALSSAILGSIENDILGMIGMQPNTLQSFMQHGPLSAPNSDIYMQNQPGQSYPLSGFANMQSASNMQSTSNMQPAPNVQAAANVQPSPIDMLNPNLQVHSPSTYGNMQHGFAQPVYSMQPGPSNMQHGSLNMQPGPSNMQPGPSNMQPGPSNMPVQYPQSSIASVKSAFKIKNPNIAPVLVKKPEGIKFKIPSLQTPAKPIPEDVDLAEILSAAKTPEKASSPAKRLAFSKAVDRTAKGKSPDAEPWINKQIKAMRRDSKSPKRARSKSPKYDKHKAMGRYSRSPERARSKSPKYNKYKGMRRNSRSPESARSKSPKYDKYKESRRSRERDNSREKDAKSKKETTVFFRNLPRSVKEYDLREKMREIGRLVESRWLGRGHATITFRNRRDAETCIGTYNMAKVDGQIIEVTWSNK